MAKKHCQVDKKSGSIGRPEHIKVAQSITHNIKISPKNFVIYSGPLTMIGELNLRRPSQ